MGERRARLSRVPYPLQGALREMGTYHPIETNPKDYADPAKEALIELRVLAHELRCKVEVERDPRRSDFGVVRVEASFGKFFQAHGVHELVIEFGLGTGINAKSAYEAMHKDLLDAEIRPCKADDIHPEHARICEWWEGTTEETETENGGNRNGNQKRELD